MHPTAKHLANFHRSERAGNNGIGFNDTWNKATYGLSAAQANILRKISNTIQGDSWVSFADLSAAIAGCKVQGCRLTKEEIDKLFAAF